MCEFCENLNEFGEGPDISYDGSATDSFHLYKQSDGVYRIECYGDHSSPINFCPMCSKKLKE